GDLAERLHEGRRRRYEPAFTEHGLDDDRGHAVWRDHGGEELVELRERGLGGPAAIFIRKRGLVDLGRVRAEVLLVRVDGAGQAEGEKRSAVEAAREADDGLAAGGGARDLDGVLDRLRPGAEEDRLLRTIARRHLAE